MVYDGAGNAPRIGLLGDSMLSGVRWYDDYGELERFNFVFDAESCRRTLEGSCWSREGYRPENAIAALERVDDAWGDVLIVTTGYNDSSYGFDEAVDAVVAEAREADIPQVVWLTMRTAEVIYEDPLHLANANTYRESNRVLFDKAAEYDGYLEVADWASHSAEQGDWFEYDGVHLTEEGVDAVTRYIADTAEAVLNGETVTPVVLPWDTLEAGDWGATVSLVQEALIDVGIDTVGDVDGIFGGLTYDAVSEFQAGRGLDVTGTVDEPTAVLLGLHQARSDAVADALRARTPSSASSVPLGTISAERSAAAPADELDTTSRAIATTSGAMPAVAIGGLGVLAMAGALVVGFAVRRIRARREPSADDGEPDGRQPQPVADIYDYERENALIG